MNESLKDFADRVHKQLRDGAVGPLRVAREVVQLGENWDKYEVEAGGKTFTQWLTATFGQLYRARWWRVRALAVQEFRGQALRLHHEAAVMLLQSVARTCWSEVWVEVNKVFHGVNRKIPLTKHQLRSIVNDVTGTPGRRREREQNGELADAERIRILREQVIELGGVPRA